MNNSKMLSEERLWSKVCKTMEQWNMERYRRPEPGKHKAFRDTRLRAQPCYMEKVFQRIEQSYDLKTLIAH